MWSEGKSHARGGLGGGKKYKKYKHTYAHIKPISRWRRRRNAKWSVRAWTARDKKILRSSPPPPVWKINNWIHRLTIQFIAVGARFSDDFQSGHVRSDVLSQNLNPSSKNLPFNDCYHFFLFFFFLFSPSFLLDMDAILLLLSS